MGRFLFSSRFSLAVVCQAHRWRHCATKSKSCGTVESQSPLHGIRVLDLTRILAGPFCTMLLGDLGAEIIKVEKPGTGDDTRQWLPPQTSDGISCYFVSINRNKQSIAIDLKKGRDIILGLVEKSDILVENFVPGTMEKLGLGYEELKSINPRLIFCSITGYGSKGPYAKRGGYDVIAASIGGFLHITGPPDGEPCKAGVAMTDLATGLYMHGAIMAGLIQRQSTNKGQKIESNLLSTQISCLASIASNYLNGGGAIAQRLGTAHESVVPYQSFQTKDDRWITIGAGSNTLFMELCDAIGTPDLKALQKFSTNTLRVKHRKELIEIINARIRTRTCTEWLEIFKFAKFPFGPVNNMEEVFNDPQVIANEVVEDLGPYKVIGPAVKFSMAENRVRSPPPAIGQHTLHVLRDILLLSENEIDELYRNSIVH